MKTTVKIKRPPTFEEVSAAENAQRFQDQVADRMKRNIKSVPATVAKVLTGKEDPTTGELRKAIDDYNAVVPDPLAHIFDGIQFRNGGKEEAIRRARSYAALESAKAYDQAQDRIQKAIAELNSERRAFQQRCDSLESSIREIKRNASEEIIAAIRRTAYGSRSGDVALAGQERKRA